MAASSSCVSRATIGGGVPAGAIMPHHGIMVAPGWPSSAKVGTSGKSAIRCGDETASARKVPCFTGAGDRGGAERREVDLLSPAAR